MITSTTARVSSRSKRVVMKRIFTYPGYILKQKSFNQRGASGLSQSKADERQMTILYQHIDWLVQWYTGSVRSHRGWASGPAVLSIIMISVSHSNSVSSITIFLPSSYPLIRKGKRFLFQCLFLLGSLSELEFNCHWVTPSGQSPGCRFFYIFFLFFIFWLHGWLCRDWTNSVKLIFICLIVTGDHDDLFSYPQIKLQ